MNIYGLPLVWCSWQIIAMLFCFEAALFMYSENRWELSKADFFYKKVRHFVLTKFVIFSILSLALIVLFVTVLFMPGF